MDADDKVMPARRASALLRTCPLAVEEKLDGFNVAIARDAAGWPVPYARSGKTQHDRGGQLGRIRAFLGDTHVAINAVLERWPVLYCEWLMREHSVAYDALPSWLVVLDLWSPTAGFAGAVERDRCCAEVALSTPPQLFSGIVGDVDRLITLTRQSRFGSVAAEGVVLRDEARALTTPVAKWLAPEFRRKSDDEFGHGGLNRLRDDLSERSELK
jgi:RNA ligase